MCLQIIRRSIGEEYHNRCQPSRNRSENPACWLLSHIPAFLLERPAFLALFQEEKIIENRDTFRRQEDILCVILGSHQRIFVHTTIQLLFAETTTVALMVYSVPTGQLIFSSRPVARTVRYVLPLVNSSGQVGEYFVHRVPQFIRHSPSWRKKRARTDLF